MAIGVRSAGWGGSVGAGLATGAGVDGGAAVGVTGAVGSGVALRFCSDVDGVWRFGVCRGSGVGTGVGGVVGATVTSTTVGVAVVATGSATVSESPHAASSHAATPVMMIGASRESRLRIDLASRPCPRPLSRADGLRDREWRGPLYRALAESSNRQ